ncbi:MAG TPA: thioredoxin domain-containing protein, partial [Candidatus Limnocylindria bacterium]|nr:thioredoxin domain-containing protein [Candidatus Limnocylindria bacterium]
DFMIDELQTEDGGFARYSTDAIWLVPHFEKMLYDNALLAHCYLEAHRATGEAAYAEVASRTLDFMIDELQTEDGGFASALDADSEGREGAYYVWTREELLAALESGGLGSDEAERVASYWDVTAEGSWEGSNVLHVAAEAPAPPLLERARAALLQVRSLRPRPSRDEKQLASWNGLAIRALAAGALLDDGYRFGVAARRAIDFVRSRLLRDGDRLWRTSRGGRSHTPAFCSDYADLADGLLATHAALGDGGDLLLARALVERAIADFWDDASGTFFDAGSEHETTIARPRSLLDDATPSANSVMADLLQRLALLTGDEDLDRRARAILRAVAPALERQPSAFGRMLAAADRALDPPVDAVVAVPGRGDPAGAALRRAVAAPYAPNLVIGSVEPGSELETWPLFAEKVARGGAATAYVCRGYACEEPTTDPERARRQVEGLAAPR